MTEHLDVLIVGAGLSGIGAAHHLTTACPWANFAVFESRAAIGGTWDLFRYPGIRSDSDMYTLGYPFRPWKGDRSIVDGASILQYIKDTAADDGTDEKIRFHHRVNAAAWSTDDGCWHITGERTDTGETVELTCSFLFTCSGYYRYDQGYTPEFAGLDAFSGTVVHPQAWPGDLDHAGKNVVVIGSGATAITLVPSMAKTAGHVTMLQRSPSYIAGIPAKDPVVKLLRKVLPGPWADPAIRWFKALTTQASYVISRKRPDLMRKVIRAGTKAMLPDGYDIDTHFKPSYDPWDQRVCVAPDGDLFKAIGKGSVSVVTDHIDTFTETGIRTRSGQEIPADIVVTATGLELLFIGGIQVSVDGEPVELPEKMTYKGMMLEGVPNLALAIGYTNASWTLKCDLTCEYVTRLLNHLHTTGLRQCTPLNRNASVSSEPLLGLTAGYMQRSTTKFPKQGSVDPWRVYQSYLRDFRALRRSDIADGVMQFTNPEPTTETPGAPERPLVAAR